MKIFGNGILWDASRNCPAIIFSNGVFETSDQRLINLAKNAGLTVEGEEKEKVRIPRSKE